MEVKRASVIVLLILLGMFFFRHDTVEAKELSANRTYSIDLNGDGKKEKIKWKIDLQENYLSDCTVRMYINGKKKKVVSGYYQGRVSVVDIKKNDGYKEVVVQFSGENDRFTGAYAFRYKKSQIEKLFSVGDEAGWIGKQKGDGYVYCQQEYGDVNLQQGTVLRKFKIKSGILKPVEKAAISGTAYNNQRNYTASRVLNIQKSLRNQKTKFKIKKGETFYILKFRLKNKRQVDLFKRDKKTFSYFYVKTKDGRAGWIKNKYKDFFYEIYSAA